MKIIMMTNTYTPIIGGLERSIMSFTKGLRKKGHKVVIVAPEFHDMPKHELGVIRLPAIKNVSGSDFSINLPIPGLLTEFIQTFKPDIIHSHHPFLVGGLALRLGKQYQIPVVFTNHTMFEWYSDFGLNNEAVQAFVVEFASGYANLADHVIAPSQSVKNILKKRGVKTPISVVPTGVDIECFKQGSEKTLRQQLKIPQKAFLLGHVGRFSPEKNLEFLVQAVAEFLQKEKEAHFLLVGKGNLLTEIKKIFKESGVYSRVHYPGLLREKKLIDAYHAMDVFTFASQSETQGMVIIEAMAAGLPVVAIDACGVREVVQNNKNGWLLKQEDKKEFVKALEWCKGLTPEKLQQMKEEARKTAELFSLENSVNKILRVYGVVQRKVSSEDKEGLFSVFFRRMETEFQVLKNVGTATGEAIKETAREFIAIG